MEILGNILIGTGSLGFPGAVIWAVVAQVRGRPLSPPGITAGVAVVVLVLGGILVPIPDETAEEGADGDQQDTAAVLTPTAPLVSPATSLPIPDPKYTGGLSTCKQFPRMLVLYSDGVVTPEELRDELKDIYDRALTAEPSISAAATQMLRANTQDYADGFADGFESMREACVNAGYLTRTDPTPTVGTQPQPTAVPASAPTTVRWGAYQNQAAITAALGRAEIGMTFDEFITLFEGHRFPSTSLAFTDILGGGAGVVLAELEDGSRIRFDFYRGEALSRLYYAFAVFPIDDTAEPVLAFLAGEPGTLIALNVFTCAEILVLLDLSPHHTGGLATGFFGSACKGERK